MNRVKGKHLLFTGILLMAVVVAGSALILENNRAERRAFYTAPPVIPHEIEDQAGEQCLACHEEVMEVDEGYVSMETPHPQFSNCLQCHVSEEPSFGSLESEFINSFTGLAEPSEGFRSNGTAPPMMPHRLFLREKCNSCHGTENPDEKMRGPHPERSNCLQCHVSDVKNEFRSSQNLPEIVE